MEWGLLLKVLALVFIVEGVMPFLTPTQWKKHLKRMIDTGDKQVRLTGLVLLVLGSVLLFVAHGVFHI